MFQQNGELGRAVLRIVCTKDPSLRALYDLCTMAQEGSFSSKERAFAMRKVSDNGLKPMISLSESCFVDSDNFTKKIIKTIISALGTYDMFRVHLNARIFSEKLLVESPPHNSMQAQESTPYLVLRCTSGKTMKLS